MLIKQRPKTFFDLAGLLTAFGRYIRRRKQPAFQALEIKHLNIVESCFFVTAIKKIGDLRLGNILMTDSRVIICVVENELFVLSQKRSRIELTYVPDEGNIAAGFKDAFEFCLGWLWFEPVKRLRCRYEVDRHVRQSRAFRIAVNAAKS